MLEQLNQLSMTELKKWGDIDLTSVSSFDTAETRGGFRTFEAEKAEKVCIGSLLVNDELQYGLCTIFARQGYDLPVFISIWEERGKEVVFMVDLMPTVDTLVGEEYRTKYIESMGKHWDRFSKLPGICPEEDDVLRSACSIIYTAARVPIEKEGLRLAALAPHKKYLKKYLEFMEAVSPLERDITQREVQRKTAALKGILRGYFQKVLKGSVFQTLGNEKIKLLVTIFS
jgi:hypothetical protein